jgi:hypothetical protein
MAVITIPTGFSVAKQTWEQNRLDMDFTSIFGAQAVEVGSPLWSTTITSSLKRPELWQAVMMQLRGRTNQLQLWNFGHPVPKGTMRGTMTASSASMGATSMTITASGRLSRRR